MSCNNLEISQLLLTVKKIFEFPVIVTSGIFEETCEYPGTVSISKFPGSKEILLCTSYSELYQKQISWGRTYDRKSIFHSGCSTMYIEFKIMSITRSAKKTVWCIKYKFLALFLELRNGPLISGVICIALPETFYWWSSLVADTNITWSWCRH